MQEEIAALEKKRMNLGIWFLFQVERRKLGCRWVHAVKLNPDGSFDHCLNASLVAKGYYQNMTLTIRIISPTLMEKNNLCVTPYFFCWYLSLIVTSSRRQECFSSWHS